MSTSQCAQFTVSMILTSCFRRFQNSKTKETAFDAGGVFRALVPIRPWGLLAFEVVEALLVGFGHVSEAVDELKRFGEAGGGLFFQVAV